MEIEYTFAISITIALVELLKRIDVEKRFERFYPLFSLVMGIGMGLYMQFDLMVCLTIGLASSGVYDIYKKSVVNK